jgi:hypothetical protein
MQSKMIDDFERGASDVAKNHLLATSLFMRIAMAESLTRLAKRDLRISAEKIGVRGFEPPTF